MVEFLTTKAITERIDTVIIGNAREKIILVSPYVKMDNQIVESLSEALKNHEGLEITMIYGKKKLPDKERKKLENINITVLYKEDLHAKCYMNEGAAIVTSMNLHEYSQAKNKEFGIMLTQIKERNIYEEIEREIQKIIDYAERKNLSEEKETSDVKMGYCIRCGKNIPLSPKHPYCLECYAKWKKYKNPDYEENVCHICGKKHATTINKPVCYSCYKKYKDTLEFPVKYGKHKGK